mgnify:CR=1 FL=1
MRFCGCEISVQEVRLAVVYFDDNAQFAKMPLMKTRIEISDDTNDEEVKACLAEMQTFADGHKSIPL